MTTSSNRSSPNRAAPMDALWSEADERGVSEKALIVDLEVFEGPLDLLLHLARHQKVDLARISVLKLAEQYLRFIADARSMRLELAADYLVMAAWLAYLKSRLLIPKQKGPDGETAEDLAAHLQFRLKRLEALREAAGRLVNRNRLGRDVFARGMPEAVIVERQNTWSATLYDLLTAYAAQRQRSAITNVRIAHRTVWSLAEAREILQRLIGDSMDWVPLEAYLDRFLGDSGQRRTAMASSFASSLELARQGHIELRQTLSFGPLLVRRRRSETETGDGK